MERIHEETPTGTGTIPMNIYVNDFGVIDFMSEASFDPFIDLVRVGIETNPVVNFTPEGYHQRDGLVVGDCLAGGKGLEPPSEANLFDFNTSYDAFEKLVGSESMEDEEESSATMSTPTKKESGKVDRLRTLATERKRRRRMKEKLYALRSLVPNITKMDKASIVGDALLYVQDLQIQAKKLKSDISGIESSMKAGDNNKGRTKKTDATSLHPIIKKIIKMDVYQLDEREIYVRMMSNRGKGIVALLYKALECLTTFNVRSSNLAASAENYVFTFTLTVSESKTDTNLQDLKLWIASIFLEQGFNFETLLHSSLDKSHHT